MRARMRRAHAWTHQESEAWTFNGLTFIHAERFFVERGLGSAGFRDGVRSYVIETGHQNLRI